MRRRAPAPRADGAESAPPARVPRRRRRHLPATSLAEGAIRDLERGVEGLDRMRQLIAGRDQRWYHPDRPSSENPDEHTLLERDFVNDFRGRHGTAIASPILLRVPSRSAEPDDPHEALA